MPAAHRGPLRSGSEGGGGNEEKRYTYRSRPRILRELQAGYGEDDLMREAALWRYQTLLERLIDTAPPEAVQDALAASDDVGGLAGLLARVGPLSPPARDPLAASRARGAQAKVALLERAGGGLSAGAVAALMGVTPAAVHARRQRGTLLAVPQANGEFIYPAAQFGPDGPLPGLGKVLAAFRVDGAWTRLSVLFSAAGELGGSTPLEALARGNVEAAASAVANYGEHLG